MKSQKDTGTTALHAAVDTGKRQLVTALLAHGADPDARLTKGPPPLRGDFVSRDGLAGATPVWLAAKAGAPAMMRALLTAGGDPAIPTTNKITPLMVAAGLGQSETRTPPEPGALQVLELLVGRGADVNASMPNGQTPLHGAANMGSNAIIQFLVDHGGRLDAKDKQGRTPLDIAGDGRRQRPTTVDLLRKLSTDPGSSSR